MIVVLIRIDGKSLVSFSFSRGEKEEDNAREIPSIVAATVCTSAE
jgi:hypothetical protein